MTIADDDLDSIREGIASLVRHVSDENTLRDLLSVLDRDLVRRTENLVQKCKDKLA